MLLVTEQDQPVRMADVFGTPRNTPIGNPWLGGYWDDYAAREAAFQNPLGKYTSYRYGTPDESQVGAQGAIRANSDVYGPRGGSDGGGGGSDDTPMAYNPEAILAAAENPYVNAALFGITGGGLLSAALQSQAQDIRDDRTYAHMNSENFTAPDPAYAGSMGVSTVGPGGWGGYDIGGWNDMNTSQQLSEISANPGEYSAAAGGSPAEYGAGGVVDGMTGLLDTVGGYVTEAKDDVLGLFADPDAPKSIDTSLLSNAAYAAAAERANPTLGGILATKALFEAMKWGGGIDNGFGVGAPGDRSNMGVYGVDPTQPGGWGFLGTELEVQQNPDITQGPYGWGNYVDSSMDSGTSFLGYGWGDEHSATDGDTGSDASSGTDQGQSGDMGFGDDMGW